MWIQKHGEQGIGSAATMDQKIMYGYLILTSLLAGIWILIWYFREDLRRKMVYSSVLSAPFGLMNIVFVPEYWDPLVLFRVCGLFDLESLLFSFFMGGIAGTAYQVVSGELMTYEKPAIGRYHAGFVLGLIFLTVGGLAYSKLNPRTPAMVMLHSIGLIGTIYVWSTRPKLIRRGLLSGLLFPVFYGSLLLVTNRMVPGFIQLQWSGYATFGLRPLGIPVDELIYAGLFGAGWSGVYEVCSALKQGFHQEPEELVEKRCQAF